MVDHEFCASTKDTKCNDQTNLVKLSLVEEDVSNMRKGVPIITLNLDQITNSPLSSGE